DPPGRAFFIPDAQGYLRISDEGVFKHFAPDLPRAEQELIAATQGNYNRKAPAQPVTQAAWRTTPSFVLVSGNDTIAPPQMQRDQAKRMKAKVIEVASSHVAMLSHPEAVAKMIVEASK